MYTMFVEMSVNILILKEKEENVWKLMSVIWLKHL
jgi:hypothetical protein